MKIHNSSTATTTRTRASVVKRPSGEVGGFDDELRNSHTPRDREDEVGSDQDQEQSPTPHEVDIESNPNIKTKGVRFDKGDYKDQEDIAMAEMASVRRTQTQRDDQNLARDRRQDVG
ncbi:hypothetical protein HD806DRAFT_519958 [Xylariaceae sp. AK1471]|nr:hypothetical protein HD806DRAFT_519958 [Xylariaceae sp. AK1471]